MSLISICGIKPRLVFQPKSLFFTCMRVLARVRKADYGRLEEKCDLLPGKDLVPVEQRLISSVIHPCERFGGRIFGGYVRDFVTREPSFKDIDIFFKCAAERECAISGLKCLNDVWVWDMNRSTSDVQERMHYGRKGRDYPCNRIFVFSKKHPEVFVRFDLVLIDEVTKQLDFDVNQLMLFDGGIFLRTDDFDLFEIIQTINKREFNVIGKVGTRIHASEEDCIFRSCHKGRILMMRMKAMEERGWTCKNKHICPNWWCVCASTESIARHVERVEKRERMKLKRIKEKEFEERVMAHSFGDVLDIGRKEFSIQKRISKIRMLRNEKRRTTFKDKSKKNGHRKEQ
jgi:hypothetical protein